MSATRLDPLEGPARPAPYRPSARVRVTSRRLAERDVLAVCVGVVDNDVEGDQESSALLGPPNRHLA
ncbi:MAG: hypothetical protein ACYDEP_05940 [Acidimicrobiales bacterium]